MPRPLDDIINAYRRDAPLDQARTIPAAWYTDPRVFDLERRTVFSRSWQIAGRIDELHGPGDCVACELANGEPILIARDSAGGRVGLRLGAAGPAVARAYRDDGYFDDSITVTEDVANLQLVAHDCPHGGLNDCITSIRVRKQ